jgi:hypothetical protein
MNEKANKEGVRKRWSQANKEISSRHQRRRRRRRRRQRRSSRIKQGG